MKEYITEIKDYPLEKIFNGALVLAISEGRDWIEATRFACKTSAIAVTRVGAQSSAPYRNEVDVFNPEK